MEVFQKRKKPKSQGFNIRNITGRKKTDGDVGLEIELEGLKFPKDNNLLAPYWAYHKDNSLRGEDNAEYVLINPIPFDDVPKALDSLWSKMRAVSTRIDDSNRTSVHVHLNCQEWHLNRLAAFISIYFCFEEVLTQWCGDHRVGNLFCLRAKDAPAIVSAVKRYIRDDGMVELQNGLHYSGLNIQALQKFGSIEIRSMRGVDNPEIIQKWVDILRRFYEMSAEYKDPRDFVAGFSSMGPLAFFEEGLGGEVALMLRQELSLTDQQIQDSMFEGVRLAQDVCYCRDWSVYEPVDLKDDPFGRSAKKVIHSLNNGNGELTAQPYQIAGLPIAGTSAPGMHPAVNPFSINPFSEEPEPESETWYHSPEHYDEEDD